MPFHSRNDLLVRTKDGRNVVLQEPLEFYSETGQLYRAPTGTTSDGASTPPALWPTIPPFGSYWLAAILHDAAYRGVLEVKRGDDWVVAMLSKDSADSLLLEAMLSLGVSEVERLAIYGGVHFGGSTAFNKDRKLNA